MSYYVGDKPGTMTHDLALDDIAPEDVTAVVAKIDGLTVTSTSYDPDAETITIETSSTWGVNQGGLHAASVKVTAGTREVTIGLESIVVEEPGPWLTIAQARARWAGAANLSDVAVYELLTVARDSVLAFAPTVLDQWGDPIELTAPPPRYVRAQLMQARNMLNAARVNASGDVGDGDFVVTPRPLDWHVRALLRPQRGRPLVG